MIVPRFALCQSPAGSKNLTLVEIFPSYYFALAGIRAAKGNHGKIEVLNAALSFSGQMVWLVISVLAALILMKPMPRYLLLPCGHWPPIQTYGHQNRFQRVKAGYLVLNRLGI